MRDLTPSLREDIRQAVERLGIDHRSSEIAAHLTLSIGAVVLHDVTLDAAVCHREHLNLTGAHHGPQRSNP